MPNMVPKRQQELLGGNEYKPVQDLSIEGTGTLDGFFRQILQP